MPTPTFTPGTARQVYSRLVRFMDQLASTDNAKGASLVGVEDAGGNFTGTDLETVLAELYTAATSAGADTFTDSETYYTTDTINAAFAQLAKFFGGKASASVTVAGGTATIAQSNNILDTQGGDPTDDVDNLSGLADGQFAALSIAANARNIVLKSGTGNIVCQGGFDVTLDVTTDVALVQRRGASYFVIALSLATFSGGGLGKALASGANGRGASMVTLEDAGGYFTLDTVEGGLAELGALRMKIVADPGTGQAIPVTSAADIGLDIGAGAETNTVADPGAALLGAEMSLWVKTAGGGTRAITFASPINAAGNTVATFEQATDRLILKAVRDGAAAYRWAIVANDGVAPS